MTVFAAFYFNLIARKSSKKSRVNELRKNSELQLLALLNVDTKKKEYFRLYDEKDVGLSDTIPEDAKDLVFTNGSLL